MNGLAELHLGMTGTYSVRTSSGSCYLVCLDEPRHVIRLAADTAPTEEYADLETSALRRDGEQIPLIALDLEVGQRGQLVLDVRRDGIATFRDITPVLAHHPAAGRAGVLASALRRSGTGPGLD